MKISHQHLDLLHLAVWHTQENRQDSLVSLIMSVYSDVCWQLEQNKDTFINLSSFDYQLLMECVLTYHEHFTQLITINTERKAADFILKPLEDKRDELFDLAFIFDKKDTVHE